MELSNNYYNSLRQLAQQFFNNNQYYDDVANSFNNMSYGNIEDILRRFNLPQPYSDNGTAGVQL